MQPSTAENLLIATVIELLITETLMVSAFRRFWAQWTAKASVIENRQPWIRTHLFIATSLKNGACTWWKNTLTFSSILSEPLFVCQYSSSPHISLSGGIPPVVSKLCRSRYNPRPVQRRDFLHLCVLDRVIMEHVLQFPIFETVWGIQVDEIHFG